MATGTITLPILGFTQDSTNPPQTIWTAADRPYLAFDGTTDELVSIGFEMPSDYASGLTIRAIYSMASATTNNIAIRTEVMAIADGETIITDNYAAVEASADSTVPGTAGLQKTVTDALATPTVAANDYISLRFGRENATSGTNATGDMYVWAIALTYTTT